MGRTIEQMIADGMTAAEIHKEVEKLTKERENFCTNFCRFVL